MEEKNILLAMKPSTFRDELIYQLGCSKFKITTAVTGEQAIQKMKTFSYDQVITQMNLERCDGLELVLNIRDLEMTMPILVISFNGSEMADDVLNAGASRFVCYPEDPSRIMELLENEILISR